MGFWSGFGSSMADSAGSGLMSNIGMVDYEINPLARAGYEDFWNDSRANAFEWSKKAADEEFRMWKDSMLQSPSLQRQGLEAAGFNPLLAVSFASGSPFSTKLNTDASGPNFANARGSNIMDNIAKAAMIRQTSAQTSLIERKTLSEGWQVKTLTRSEAQGLGANLIHALGFNFHDSSQDTFLVAYNPITGELRNLGDTSSGLGTTGAPTNAAEVNAIPVDWKTDKSPRYLFNPDDWELKPEYRK